MNIEGVELREDRMPNHIAIIMDGNTRWAKKNKKKTINGHRQGLETLIQVLETALDLNIRYITAFAFSTENWKRPKEEVNGLMKLFEYFFNREFAKIKKNKIRVIHSGKREGLPKHIIKIIDSMINDTKDNDRAVLNLAINYSGRSEIIEAVKRIYNETEKSNKNFLNELTEEDFSKYLFQSEVPEPELLIRTSGEMRISNFLLWQMAYTEMVFTDILWPDFTTKRLCYGNKRLSKTR